MFFYRLDFVTFTTAQPTGGTCTDTFEVGGSSNIAPTICGDNSGQHSKKRPVTFEFLFSYLVMCIVRIVYLDVPSSAISPTDVQLVFYFPSGTAATSLWNIKIAMLPCEASYLGILYNNRGI